MDQKENTNTTPQGDEWIKTITDVPISDLGAKKNFIGKSPYAHPENPPEILIGEVLGSGPITDVLGEGGFARVYKIRDKKLDMDRAVKVLLPTGKKEVTDRFLTEARITARLNHPNIVNVYRVDEWKGCPFIEMEYIEGKSLETLLKERGKFPAFAVCAVGIAIAQALKYSHALDFTLSDKQYKGVIHRDLKPANIMVRNEGTLKLMDFGIARPISNGFFTMDGNIVGTLQYLAPEQLNHKEVDQRTDIYSVGAILYEQLCGIKAFPDEGLTDLVNKKANGIYKPFQEISISVPKKLAEIVDTCLKVDKEERYLNASALLDALNTVYTQFASEPPETALKNFMENPGYIPVRSSGIEKKRLPPKRNHQVQAPEKPAVTKPAVTKPASPKFKLPSLPAVRLPKIPKLKLPEIKFQKVGDFFVRGFNGTRVLFNEILGHIVHFGKLLWSIAVNGISYIRIPPKAIKMVLGSLGVIAAIGCILFLVIHQSKVKGSVSQAKKSATDTIVNLPISDLAPVDTALIKPYTPEIIVPAANEVVQSETLTVVWHSMAKTDNYVLQIDTGSQFTDSLFIKTVARDTSCTITDLEPATYYCRVGVSGSNEFINWSSARSFKFSPVYRAPRLAAPLPGDTVKNCEVTLKWRKLPKTQSYMISVASDSSFEQVVFDSIGCRDTFISRIFVDTIKTYYWHVATVKGDNWSKTGTFVINDKTDYCKEAAVALQKGNLSGFEKIIQKIPPGDYCKDTLKIRLAEKYLKSENYTKAGSLLATVTLQDMLVYFLKAELLKNDDKYSDALNLLDSAINSKTLFTSWEDSSDVFYLRAKVAHMVYEEQKNRKNGEIAYAAWTSIEKRYNLQQKHERYLEAVAKMNLLYYTDKFYGPVTDTVAVNTPNADTLNALPGKSKKRWRQKGK